MLRVPLILAAALLPACAAPESTSAWGAGVTLRPGWARVGQALHAAAVDPVTWIPVAGAGLLSIDDVDEDIGEWAAEKTPLFGSRDGADRYSTDVRKALVGLSIVSSLATFSGEELDDALPAKLKGLALRQATVATSRLATNELKDAIGRERPDEGDRLSMPSGHTSAAFTNARWIVEDLDWIGVRPGVREGLRTATWTAAASVAWARVEANRHHPTDVLLGAALGNFTTLFFREAFFGQAGPDAPRLSLELDGDAALLSVRFSF